MTNSINNHNGIMYGMIILIMLIMSCHISNYLFPKYKKCMINFKMYNIDDNKLTGPLRKNVMDTRQDPFSNIDYDSYNRVHYLNDDKSVKIPCQRLQEDHPDISDNLRRACNINCIGRNRPERRNNMYDNLTEEDKAIIMLTLLNESALEAMGRQ